VVFAHHIQENEKEKELCKFILIRFRWWWMMFWGLFANNSLKY
jgi:hypothetical protein